MKSLEKKYLSVSQYAERYKITRQAVLKRINTGKVEALKLGNYYLIKI